MAVVPRTKLGRVQFYENHVAPWSAHAADLGLSPADVAALEALAAEARAAFNAQQAALQAARAATGRFNAAVAAVQAKGSGLIAKVKATAAGAADPVTVYNLAEIPAPAEPSPVPAPGKPWGLEVTLNADGSLGLAWKCDNPAGGTGTMYEVRRKVAGAGGGAGEGGGGGAFAFLGSTGTRSFTDDTLPAGSASLVYEVTAVRSTKRGRAAQFAVNFGVSGGAAFAAVAQAQRVAA